MSSIIDQQFWNQPNGTNPTYDGRFEYLKMYILYNLGYPQITVELKDEHILLCILEAVKKFNKTVYMEYSNRIISVNGNKAIVPNDINPRSIIDIFFERDALDSLEKMYMTGGIVDSMGIGVLPINEMQRSFIENMQIENIYMYMRKMQDFKNLLGLNKRWEISNNNEIILYPKEINYKNIIIVYRGNMTDEMLEQETWVAEYALARAKIMLGTIRSKFSGFSSGGVNLGTDGEALKSEGREEVTKLLEELNLMAEPCPILKMDVY